MSRPRLSLRLTARPAALALAALTGLAVAGCDLQTNADTDRGQVLFQQKCSSCHTLAALGSTKDLQGPNLDAAFAQARADGMDEDTIEGIVQGQIENPREITLPPDDPTYSRTSMPANLVEGQDAEDVAAYVASVAGVPGIEPDIPPDPGAQVFVENGCGQCHTLAALGEQAVGTVGPVLDDVIPGQDPADVERSITDPDAEKSPGFEGASMPPFADIPEAELQDLIDFLLKEAGRGGKGE